MKRLLVAAVLASGFLASTHEQAKAQCGFGIGIGIGLNISFTRFGKGHGCQNQCGYPYCGYPACGYGGFAPYGAPPPMSHAAMMGMPGTAMAGMPFGMPYGGMPFYPGMSGLPADQAALAVAGAPGYAGYPALFAGPGFGMNPAGYDPIAMAQAINPINAMQTWGSYPTLPAMPGFGGAMAGMPGFDYSSLGGFGGMPATGMAYGYPIPVMENELSPTTDDTPPVPTTERGAPKLPRDALAIAEEEE